MDPLSPHERAELLAATRPRRSLPVLERREARRLPLAAETRPIDRADRPIYAVWELTLRCDLACRHCGSRAGQARPDELPLDAALDLVRQMAELGVREVTLIGGEVYLYDGWTEVVREIRARGMQCTLVTGGRGMTDERARAAKAAGVQSLAVSIDGDEVVHDRLRAAAGSYAAARRALEACKRAGLQVAVNTQVNRLSMPCLPHVFDVVCESGAHGWQVQLTVPAGRAADEPEVILQPYDLLTLFPLLEELHHRAVARGIKLLPGNNVGYFGPHDHVLRRMFPEGHSMSCIAGRLGLGIEADGSIKGCPSLPTDRWVGGTIEEHALVDIWERSHELRHNRDRTVDELWGFCKSCYYADECRAGCTWMTTTLFGRPGNNPYCHHRALEHQRVGKRERVALRRAAPGEPFDHGLWDLVVEDDPSYDAGQFEPGRAP